MPEPSASGRPRPLKDLRGQEYRSVHRSDDAVIITGAEYLRKSMALSEAEFAAARIRSEAERETVQRIVERLRERFAQGRLRKVSTDPFRLGFDRAWEAFGVVIDHIELEFGGEDKGGEPRQ